MRILTGYGPKIEESLIKKDELEYFNFLYKYNFEISLFYSTVMNRTTFSKELKNYLFSISLQDDKYWVYIKFKQSYKIKLQKFTMRDISVSYTNIILTENMFKKYASTEIRKEKLKCLQ